MHFDRETKLAWCNDCKTGVRLWVIVERLLDGDASVEDVDERCGECPCRPLEALMRQWAAEQGEQVEAAKPFRVRS